MTTCPSLLLSSTSFVIDSIFWSIRRAWCVHGEQLVSGDIFLAGSHCLINFFFLFHSFLFSQFLSPLMQSQRRTHGRLCPEALSVCTCVWNLTLWVGGGWWPLTLQHSWQCTWGPRPPDGYLRGSVSRWIEPPLCFTAGLSRTLRSQCMIHYPIGGRVTHPWVILSNPVPTLSLPDAPSAKETKLMGLFLVWRILKIDFTGCGRISHDHGPHLSKNLVGWSHAKFCDSCVWSFWGVWRHLFDCVLVTPKFKVFNLIFNLHNVYYISI